MALTQDDINKLTQAVVDLATGDRALELEFSDGTRVRYASLRDVQAALDSARARFAQQHRSGLKLMPIRTHKGLY